MKKLVRFDWAAKKLLRSKANFGILEGFLSEVLKEDIRIEHILESEGNKDSYDDKYNRVDLLVKNSHEELIIIEVQIEDQIDYFQRIFYGISKVTTEYIKESEEYSKIKKVISISILYFDLGQGGDYVYHGRTNFVGIHDRKELKLSPKQKKEFRKTHLFELLPEYYLIKVNQFNDLAKDPLDEWIYFLKNEEIKKEFNAKGLREAKKKLDVLKLPEKERKTYERFMESVRDKNSFHLSTFVQGHKKGLEQGIEQALKKMIQSGISEDEARKILGI